MSFGGPAASTSGWCTRPGERGIGSTGCAGRRRSSLLTGPYAMATAEHREPCDSRGSCTVLGAPGGETPSGDSSKRAVKTCPQRRQLLPKAAIEAPFPRSRGCYSVVVAGGKRCKLSAANSRIWQWVRQRSRPCQTTRCEHKSGGLVHQY